MDDSLFVDVLDRLGDLPHQVQPFVNAETVLPLCQEMV